MFRWLIIFFGLSLPCTAQPSFKWPNGKKAAIVLTYDDALLSQLDIAIPQLDSFHFKGTFFLSGNLSEGDMLRWQRAALKGHELANHTLFHPCAKETLKGKPRYVTENYEVEDILREISMMNKLLFGIDHRKDRTYAFPCAETIAGGRDYADSLGKAGIKYARIGGNNDAIITDFSGLDPFRVPSWGFGDNPDGTALVAFAQHAINKNGLAIYMFHGVGGDYLNVTAAAHRQLIRFLKQHKEIWVTTFREALDYISNSRKKQ